MTDINRVLTALNPKLVNNTNVNNASRNWIKPADSDRPLYLDQNGFVNSTTPSVISCASLVATTSANDVNASAADTILTGNFWTANSTGVDVTVQLPASTFSPYHLIIYNFASANAVVTLEFPDPPEIASFLRKFVPGFFQAGACWTISFINHNATHDLVLSVPVPGTGQTPQRIGFNTNTEHTLAPKSSCRFTIYVQEATANNEQFYYFIH